MVTYQPKDVHLLVGSIIKTQNLTLRLISQNQDQVTTVMDGHLPSLGGSPTNPRVVTHQKEVFYRFDIWLLDLIHKTKTI